MTRDDHPADRLEKRTGSQRPRTVSISLPNRGQTTQDFVVGIGIFLLAIAFVVSFLPSLVTPFDSSVGGAETAQADRIADRLVHNLSSEVDSQNPNEILWDDPDEDADFATYSEFDDDELASALGLRITEDGHAVDRLNVSVQDLGGDSIEEMEHHTVGREYDDQSAASSARIVTVDEDLSGQCDPACRLVVRVW